MLPVDCYGNSLVAVRSASTLVRRRSMSGSHVPSALYSATEWAKSACGHAKLHFNRMRAIQMAKRRTQVARHDKCSN